MHDIRLAQGPDDHGVVRQLFVEYRTGVEALLGATDASP